MDKAWEELIGDQSDGATAEINGVWYVWINGMWIRTDQPGTWTEEEIREIVRDEIKKVGCGCKRGD